MTVKAILNEIEKRIEYPEKQREELENKLSYARVCGNDKEAEVILKKRNKNSYEREKLKDMRRAYKGAWFDEIRSNSLL